MEDNKKLKEEELEETSGGISIRGIGHKNTWYDSENEYVERSEDKPFLPYEGTK